MLYRLIRDKKGQGFVEYALLVAGIALVGAIGVTIIGQKSGELLDAMATVIPASTPQTNNDIQSGALIEYTTNEDPMTLELNLIRDRGNTSRLSNNLGYDAQSLFFNDVLIDHPTFFP